MRHTPQRLLPNKRRRFWTLPIFDEGVTGFDYVLLLAVAILLAVGLIEVYSASSHTAALQRNDPHFFFKSHLFRLLVGGLVLVGVVHLPPRHWPKIADGLLAVSIILLVCVLAWGVSVHGGKRWLRIAGFTFEPSEIARFALVVFVATKLGDWRNKRDQEDSVRHLVLAFAATGVVAGLVAMQPDIDTAGLMVIVFLLMLVFAGVERNVVLVSGATALSAAVVLMVVFGHFQSRIFGWLASRCGIGIEGAGANTQVTASLAGMADGGLLRFRPGRGALKYSFLPMAFSDFVFAIIGEEFGLVGTLAVVGLFAVVLWRGIRIAVRACSADARLIAMGLTASIALYAVVNMLVVTGMAPTSGLPLPFISYGGTATVVNMLAVGVLLAISRESIEGAEGYLSAAAYRERLRRRGLPVGRPTTAAKIRPWAR
ncbi:MAG: putative peptidoglycan glycosyltransferase FtsW [bacterium]|jgi:cell division protein FtsW|nr:putative lipid II flippase FtsW [candidate division KSB1 bacterium]MDH7559186.1 putative peptidoglycan glycosyltransferase FtsW [bacterium]